MQDRRITRLETDMATLSLAVSELRMDTARMGMAIDGQSKTLDAMATDTREIRDLMRGGKVFGKLAAWVGGIVTVPLSVYGLFSFIRKWLQW